MSDRIGRTFSHYRIVAPLGSGGMGTVYRAEDTLLGRPVALKFPHRELVHDEPARARFLREARASSALDHPHIVTLYDVCDADGEVFIAMQYVDGRSLRDRIDTGPLPLRELLGVGRAVADALAHAHGRGVVHRDIKPENILVGEDGRVKVADFGTARLIEESRTLSTDLVGTPAYLPPEAYAGAPAAVSGDLYALGVLLYEMMSGTAPFGAGHVAEIAYRVVHESPAPLPPAAPTGLQRLVESLLAKSPEARPANAIDVADALARLAGAPASAAEVAGVPERSIAVLPFQNLTGSAEDDYFCAGIAEDLLTDVLRVPDLHVASRTRVAGIAHGPVDLKRAAQQLGVATVLEGGVRRAGSRVRVTARLVRADTGYQMWAERYDRELADLFDVQEDISRNITAALRVVFDPHGAEPGRRTGSARAYDLRLQGLAHMRRFEAPDMRRAVELLREALREDPHYALARAALAEAEVQLICKEWETDPAWLDRAEADARGALEIAPRLPEAHSALGHLMFHRRRPAEAIRAYQTSVDIDPSHAEGLLKLGNAYLFIGDATRAEIYARRAQAADPSDDRCTAVLVTILVRQRRLREAREVARQIGAPVKINHMTMVRDLVLSHAWEGDMDEALRAADVVRERFPREEAFTASVRAVALAYAGRLDEARALIEPAPDDAIHNSDVHLTRARVRVLLGDREGALRSIEHAERLVLVDIDELRTDPQLATLWDDPLVRRIVADRNLPWRPA